MFVVIERNWVIRKLSTKRQKDKVVGVDRSEMNTCRTCAMTWKMLQCYSSYRLVHFVAECLVLNCVE